MHNGHGFDYGLEDSCDACWRIAENPLTPGMLDDQLLMELIDRIRKGYEGRSVVEDVAMEKIRAVYLKNFKMGTDTTLAK